MRNKILAGIGILVALIVLGNAFSGDKTQVGSEKVVTPNQVVKPSPEAQRSYPPESLVTPKQFQSNEPTIQQNTGSSYKQSSYTGGDKDCGDFSTHAEAQAFFEAQGPGDPHRLDRDGDGLACETLP